MKLIKPHKLFTKKGQVWTIDYFVGLFIFVAVVFTALTLMRNLSSENDTYTDTLRESDHIAAMLLSEISSNTTNISIAVNNRVNKTLLSNFDALTYSQTKIYFQSSGEYVFYFYNGTVINETVCFRGFNMTSGCLLNISQEASNIAKTERLVILNSTIVKLVVISWS